MSFANPPPKYDPGEQSQFRQAVDTALRRKMSRESDVELVDQRLIMTSPNGTRYVISVNDSGSVIATSL